MIKYIFALGVCWLLTMPVCMSQQQPASATPLAQRVDSVLKMMTPEEKIGQMNQYNGDWAATGPITKDGDKQNQIRRGMVGSMLNVTGVAHTKTLQEIAMQSRLKIPLLFGQDVIHGYRTIFLIPLAEAASWDMEAISTSAGLQPQKPPPREYIGPLHQWLILPVTPVGAG